MSIYLAIRLTYNHTLFKMIYNQYRIGEKDVKEDVKEMVKKIIKKRISVKEKTTENIAIKTEEKYEYPEENYEYPEENYEYPEAPDLLILENEEKFKDNEGNAVEIETRG